MRHGKRLHRAYRPQGLHRRTQLAANLHGRLLCALHAVVQRVLAMPNKKFEKRQVNT